MSAGAERITPCPLRPVPLTVEDRMAETATAVPKPDDKKKPLPRDPLREAIETVVFVVVLVLLLKLFVTEAFVIPTGSMAETLYGYQKIVTCPKCGHEFPVNSHDEVEGRDGRKTPLTGCVCPNCRFDLHFPLIPGTTPPQYDSPPNRTGDRVLVLKPIYHVEAPQRGDVVVFKFPKEPQQKQTAQNYIKRVQGFGGETLAIHRGKLFVTRSLEYPSNDLDVDGTPLYPRPADPHDLWRGGDSSLGHDYRYPNNQKAVELFEKSRLAGFPVGKGYFELVRKPTAQVLADMRPVWDNDQQPRELAEQGVPPRWHDPLAESQKPWVKWTPDDPRRPRVFTHAGDDLDWVRYRHLVWTRDPNTTGIRRYWTWGDHTPPEPGPVDNFLAYNAGEPGISRQSTLERLWVGDLILECEAELGSGAEVVLELSKGSRRYQAKFSGGQVSLSSTGPDAKEFGVWPCKVSGPGKYALRFANVDCRLRVWVNDRLIDFGTDADHSFAEPDQADGTDPEGWTEANDVAAPASIGVKGAATIRRVKLFRDVYYTRTQIDHNTRSLIEHNKADLYYIQPGHYLCLGDNSASSSDSRSWGLVPERLLLGKAVFVFWPASRIGFIK